MTKPNALDSVLRIFPDKRQIPEKKPKTYILYPFELHAKMKETFEEKLEESKRLARAHIRMFNRIYVANSYGKDSLVMNHIVWNVAKEEKMEHKIEFWINDTLNTYKEEKPFWDLYNRWLGIEDKVRVFAPPKLPNGRQATVWTVAEMVGHLPFFRSTAKTKNRDYKHTNTPECCDWLKKKSVKEYLKSLPKDERFDCTFIGTRAEENQNRSLGVLQRCRSYLITTRYPYPIRACTILSFWTKADIYEYFTRFQMPMNPTYQIHQLERMGCASCPAHIGWEQRLAKDPTEEGFGMLKQNLKIMRDTDPSRFTESLERLENYVKSRESGHELTEHMRVRLLSIIKEFDKGMMTLMDYQK